MNILDKKVSIVLTMRKVTASGSVPFGKSATKVAEMLRRNVNDRNALFLPKKLNVFLLLM
jgi:hypothetical protein